MKLKSNVSNTKPTDVIKHLIDNFAFIKNNYADVYSREIYSALVYQYILNRHGHNISVDQILKDEPYIGLLGQKDEFEVFHTISFLRLHAILHDAFGRVYIQNIGLIEVIVMLLMLQSFLKNHHFLDI